MTDDDRGNMDDTTDSQHSSSIWERMRDSEVSVEQKPQIKVELRVGVVFEDVILQDEEQIKQINETFEKLKDGSKSVCDDLKMIFTEEPRRVIYEMGNVEFVELGQISMTVQCHSCLKHVPEGNKILWMWSFVFDQMKTQ